MQRAATFVTALSLIALAGVPARAELGAGGARLSIAGGAPRFYMTYGHIDEPELFAPILVELKRLDVSFDIEGDTCTVLHKGARVATWPVVRSRDALPAAPNQPFILMLGSNTFLPIKRLAKLLPIDVKWDRRSNTVAVVAGAAKPEVAKAPPKAGPLPPGGLGSVPIDPAATGAIELSGLSVEQVGAGFRLRVRSSAPVRPTTLYLKSPTRIAIDFPNARWAHGLQAPAGKGGLRSLRLGHPTPGQARLVLEVTSAAVKISGVEVEGNEVQLALGGAAPVARAVPPASGSLSEKVRAAVSRRTNPAMVRLTQSRGVIRVTPNASQLPGDAGSLAESGLPGSNSWQYIVIHHSATPSGNATSFDAVHRRKAWDGLAYHFVINNGKGNPDGHLEVSQRWSTQKHGAHAGGLPGGAPDDVRNGFNEFGIGICLVGNFQRSKPSEKQLRTLAVLIQELRAEFGIPAENVLGHGHVKGTACPGDSFPWKQLFALMELPAPARHKHAPLRTTARCPWCQLQAAEK